MRIDNRRRYPVIMRQYPEPIIFSKEDSFIMEIPGESKLK
jgi:hypothetical protein